MQHLFIIYHLKQLEAEWYIPYSTFHYNVKVNSWVRSSVVNIWYFLHLVFSPNFDYGNCLCAVHISHFVYVLTHDHDIIIIVDVIIIYMLTFIFRGRWIPKGLRWVKFKIKLSHILDSSKESVRLYQSALIDVVIILTNIFVVFSQISL